MKKIMAIGIICSLLVTSFSAFAIANEENGDSELTVMYSFETPIVESVDLNGDLYDRVIMDGVSYSGNPGEPRLPARGANILLPQGTKVNDIKVIPGEMMCLGSGYLVEPIGECVPLSEINSAPLPVPDKEIYSSIDMFPSELFTYVGTYDFRGYTILTLILYPTHYIGEDGEIYYYDEMTVTIRTSETDSISSLLRRCPRDEMMMQEMVDDYCMGNTYVVFDPGVFQNSFVNSSESYEYVVITNEELENARDTFKDFQDLVQYKIDNGISAKIVTLEDIYATYDGVDKAERIRNFITDAYLNWGTEYVLLGGDADVVPVRRLWVMSNPETKQTTITAADLYYGCLAGSYNSDNDTLWGEPTDGEDGGDVDLVAEVYVGRACVGNATEVNNFVMKTLAYEQSSESDPYLRNALLAGQYLGLGGAADYAGNYLDEMINGSDAHGYSTVGIPSGEYQIDTLYDRDWPGNNWPTIELLDRINAGVNIIDYLGHGCRDGWGKMCNSDVYSLENTEYAFIYSQACNVGGFDETSGQQDDCFAEFLTVKTSHGAFAVIMNAREGWGAYGSTDGPSQRFNREFFDAVFNEGVRDPEKTCLGVANQDSKEDNLWRINEPYMRWCYYELNLLGDPQISLKPVPVYEHDIAVDSIELSENVNPDETFNITVTVINQGSNDETDISGNVTIFEVINAVNIEENLVYKYPWSIDCLVSGDEAIVEFNYSLPRGLYRIRGHIDPVPEEDIIFNNNMTTGIFIGDNNPPDTPDKPSGPTNGQAGTQYNYTTQTTDPDGDQVYYKWCWGFYMGNMYSNWLGPFDSGVIVEANHTWNGEGTYQISVRAKDVYGYISDWSEPLEVSMPINQQFISKQYSIMSGKQSFVR